MPGFPDVYASGYVEDQLVASAARTTSGDSGILSGFGPASGLRCQLEVTAASGTTPTLNVVIEDTLDGTTWNVIGTHPQLTAAGRNIVDITGLFANRIRVRWTIGGTTPSFTFNVRAVAQTAAMK